MEVLAKCIRPPQLRKALDSLPETLYDTYAEMLDKIYDENYEVALRMFHWLLFSNGPRSIEELAELAAMEFGDDCPTMQRFYEPTEVLKICPGFLTAIEEFSNDEKKGETKTLVRIAHVSIREYLMSSEIGKSRVSRYQITADRARAEIIKTCLRYMQLIDQPFKTVSRDDFPLAPYAMEQWINHYRNVSESDEESHELVYDFFVNHREMYMKWADYFYKEFVDEYLPGYTPRTKDDLRTYVLQSPLNAAAANGLIPLLSRIFERNDIDTTNTTVLRDALQASRLSVSFPRPPSSDLEVTRFLIEHGADFASDACYASTLHGASFYGFIDLVQAELKAGADVNSQGGKYASALDAAITGRYVASHYPGTRRKEYLESVEPSCIKILLEHGADPNVCSDMMKGTPLIHSSYEGDILVVRMLLAHGADPNFHLPGGSRMNRSCLSAACYSGDLRIFKLLIEHGASIHSSLSLEAACMANSVDMVKYLLANGANPNGNRDESNDGSPLEIAYSEAIVELLLQYGADINLGWSQEGSPLIRAALYGNLSVTKKLIEKGANVNMMAGMWGPALHAAATIGHVDVAECLIKAGADVNLQCGRFKNALQAALSDPRTDISVLLLRSGADVDVKSSYGSTLVEALRNAPPELGQVYIQQPLSNKPSESTWIIVKRPANSSFTDFDVLEILESKRPIDSNDPGFLCSLEPF